jgi:hypothetical protein
VVVPAAEATLARQPDVHGGITPHAGAEPSHLLLLPVELRAAGLRRERRAGCRRERQPTCERNRADHREVRRHAVRPRKRMICMFVLLLADVASAARVRPRTGPCLRSPEGRDHAPEIRWPHRDHGPGADIELALAHRLLADVDRAGVRSGTDESPELGVGIQLEGEERVVAGPRPLLPEFALGGVGTTSALNGFALFPCWRSSAW